MPDEYEILNKLASAVDMASQFNIIGVDFKPIDDICVEWLRLRGYSVRAGFKYPNKIKNLNDLIYLFYGLLLWKYPKHLAPYRNEKQERKIAKDFVESRIKADNISRVSALQQCGEIINTIFNNLERFNFNSPPTFGILGQGNMGWVTDVAIKIMNSDLNEYRDALSEKIIEEYIAEIEQNESENVESELNTILENLEEKVDGEKEKEKHRQQR